MEHGQINIILLRTLGFALIKINTNCIFILSRLTVLKVFNFSEILKRHKNSLDF